MISVEKCVKYELVLSFFPELRNKLVYSPIVEMIHKNVSFNSKMDDVRIMITNQLKGI